MRPESVHRCDWVGSDPLYRTYHDREWGVPVHDDRLLFEFLTLEGAQAGMFCTPGRQSGVVPKGSGLSRCTFHPPAPLSGTRA